MQKVFTGLFVLFWTALLGGAEYQARAEQSRHLVSSHISPNLTHYLNGIALYGSAHDKEAYSELEQAFQIPQLATETRQNIATILAYAPSHFLKAHRRTFYAEAALENKKLIPPKILSALLRIAADGFFDEQNFEKAKHYYDCLNSHSDEIISKAYTQYRLAWIDLNLKNPSLAFTRLSKFIEANGNTLQNSDLELYQSMVKDAGRAWTESAESPDPQIESKTKVHYSHLYDSQKEAFSDGILMALKRLTRADQVEAFRSELYQTSYAENIFTQSLQRGVPFRTFPCEILRWNIFPKENLTSELRSKIELYATECAQKISNQHLCSSPDGLKIQEHFENLGNPKTLTDPQIISRISLSVSCEDWYSGCRDILNLAMRKATQQQTRLDGDQMHSLFDLCQRSLTSPKTHSKSISLLQQTFLELLNNYKKYQLINLHFEDPIFLLFQLAIQDSIIRSFYIQTLTQNANDNQDSLLPQWIAQSLDETQLEADGMRLFISFSRQPIQNPWLRILSHHIRTQVDSKNYSDAFHSLRSYFFNPQEFAQNEELSELWEYYWLGIDDSKTYPIESLSLIHPWFQALPHKSLQPARKVRALAIMIKYGDIKFIWNKWPYYSEQISQHLELSSAFYQKTLEQMKNERERPDQSLQEALLQTKEGELLTKIAQADPSLSISQIEQFSWDANFTFSGILSELRADISALQKIKAQSLKIQKIKFSLNSHFLQKFTQAIKLTHKQRSDVYSQAWNHSSFLKKASQILVIDQQYLLNELNKIQTSIIHREELKEIEKQLSDIKLEILDQMKSDAKLGEET